LPVLRAEISPDTTVSHLILQTDAETAVARVREGRFALWPVRDLAAEAS
jgi:hypothetical protein